MIAKTERYAVCLLLTIFLFPVTQPPAFCQGLFINEYMASNSTTIADPDYHDFADWIELYNAGNTSVNLKGYYITDDLSQPKKYKFPSDLIIQPQSWLLIWADNYGTGNHTSFKLSASGESIGLYDPSGNIIDTLSFGVQENDISYGRFPDGSSAWFKFSPASPGKANSESQILNRLAVPIVSQHSGFYPSSLAISVTHPVSGAVIRYTIDGRTPTAKSPAYSSAIHIDSTTVLRVRAFKDGYLPSTTLTSTYFIHEQTDLPAFSLATDPENFFSDTSGIYVEGTNGIIANCSTAPRNWNQDWERVADIELFEKDKASVFKVTAGVKIFGGCARLYPEKSLVFNFRSEYGFSKLAYRLFPDQVLTEYDNFVLRNSGQDWWRTMFRDGMAQTLTRQGMRLDIQDYRPSILFINGAYWGIHNIREKLNDHYVTRHYGVSEDSIDFVEIAKGIVANAGDLDAYNAMINFLNTNNMALPANYDHIKSIVDMDEYIDYNVAEIYSANGDWPGANMKLWRQRTPAAKWRWTVSDLDFTFGGNSQGQYNTNTLDQATATNGPSWPNPPWATLMLRKLLDNPDFKNEFIQRFAVHLNTTYDSIHVHAYIDSLAQGIASDIPRHKLRWAQSLSLGPSWAANIQVMKDFATNRPAAMRGFINTKFGIAGSNTLAISRNTPAWGKVFTHLVEVQKNGADNVFFRNIPLRIRAMAMPGYRFVRWEGIITSTAPETTIVLNTNSTLTAVFEAATLSVTGIVINEINYKSSPLFDTDDWVELYNTSGSAVNLAGWKFRDSTNSFTFPPNSSLAARDYLVLCRDTANFRLLRPEVRGIIGNTNFGLSSTGELIQLIDTAGATVDEVRYSSSGKWTSLPNGSGSTLSLINPQANNMLPESWQASIVGGTPGRLNDVYAGARVEPLPLPDDWMLFNNYPNPFNSSTIIRFALPERSETRLTIYNRIGQKVSQLLNGTMERGYHEVTFSAGDLSSGLYFYELSTPKFRNVKKLLLLK